MDDDLRTCLWNAFYENIWNTFQVDDADWEDSRPVLIHCGRSFWIDLTKRYFKQPIDEVSTYAWDCSSILKQCFLNADWAKVYDFIEFLYTCTMLERGIEPFTKQCNQALEREMSGYRIINGRVTPITNSTEITSLEEAVKSPYEYANQHLHCALEKLSDRDNPDYRNSIKESITAVEAICRKLTNESTLDRALNKIGNKIDFNSQFKQGLEKLYYYTHEESRHALMKDSTTSFDEAKFMLVACSAFVNYLTAKASVLND